MDGGPSGFATPLGRRCTTWGAEVTAAILGQPNEPAAQVDHEKFMPAFLRDRICKDAPESTVELPVLDLAGISTRGTRGGSDASLRLPGSRARRLRSIGQKLRDMFASFHQTSWSVLREKRQYNAS